MCACEERRASVWLVCTQANKPTERQTHKTRPLPCPVPLCLSVCRCVSVRTFLLLICAYIPPNPVTSLLFFFSLCSTIIVVHACIVIYVDFLCSLWVCCSRRRLWLFPNLSRSFVCHLLAVLVHWECTTGCQDFSLPASFWHRSCFYLSLASSLFYSVSLG